MTETIAVCLATYDRPDGLRAALAAVAAQTFDRLPGPLPESVVVLVIDNNPGGEAQPVVDDIRATGYPWPLRYAWERQPGIASARNRALDVVRGFDLLAFLDDDEEPAPHWLAALLAVQRRCRADVVAGPVHPRYPPDAPRWLTAGRFLEPPDHPDGARVGEAWSGNVMFRPGLAARLGVRFNEAQNLSGGEDTLFFARLRRRGCRLRWSATATVTEAVPPERLRVGWLLRRWYRTGITDALVAADARTGLWPGLWGRLRTLGGGAGRTVVGGGLALALLPLAPWRPDFALRRAYTLCRGLGMMAQALNRGDVRAYRLDKAPARGRLA